MMIQEFYCGIKEHQNVTSVCLMENCKYQSRLVCKICNSKQFHDHNNHLLDLEIIFKNQEALKDQSFQYHSNILNFNKMERIIGYCRQNLETLLNILYKQRVNYEKYIQNLHIIQINLNQKVFQIKVDDKLAAIINSVNNFNEEQNKKQILDIFNTIFNKINQLNECIQSKINDDKLFQVVKHTNQIQFAQISPNGQDLLFGSNLKLYSYNFEKYSYEQICKISGTTYSFVISKDYSKFYFDYNGSLKIYNKHLKKNEQIKLQKCEIKFIRVLSKDLAAAYYQSIKQLYIINLKLKKKVFKLNYDDIYDMHYIEPQNLLIVAQLSKVDIIMLNSKFKSQELDQNNREILNIQFDQQNQQLIILETQGILTFWSLEKNGLFIKNLFQINTQELGVRFFRYNQNLQQYIVFTSFQVIFYNIQGQIIQRLSHSYQNLDNQKTFSNYCQDPIIFRYYDSITLLRGIQK